MLKRLLAKLAAAGAALAFCAAAMAAPLPSMTAANSPINPAIINDFNLFLNQLNGGPGYSGTSQIVSLGSSCTASGATPQTCNGQRGVVSFTGVAVTASGGLTTVTINDSFITAASDCQATVQTASATGAAALSSAVPGAGTLAVALTDASATAVTAQTFAIAFNCVN